VSAFHEQRNRRTAEDAAAASHEQTHRQEARSGWRGRPSSGIGSHGAAYATNCR
jgi:hypothetical protein